MVAAAAAGERDTMIADALLLALVFALCGAGALAGFMLPGRRNPALLFLLAWEAMSILRSPILATCAWRISSLTTTARSLSMANFCLASGTDWKC